MLPLLKKTLRDKRWVILGWMLGMGLLCIFTLSFFPTFSETKAFDEIFKNLPQQFQGLLGDSDTFRKLPNYVGAQLYDIRLPLLTIVLAVVMAVGLTVSEEESGTLKTLQSLPIARRSVVIAKWLSLGLITGLVTFAAVPGVLIGAALINKGTIDAGDLLYATTLLWLLSFGVAAFGFMVGFATGRKSLTVGLVSLFAVYNIFLAWFASSVDWLQDVYKFTLYYYFNNPQPVVGGVDWWHVVVLAAAPVVFGLVGLVVYQRRDIEAA